MRIISLGWGVQSFTLAAMAALGELPGVDAALHADTTHERSATYEFARRWMPFLESHGVRVVTVISADTTIINSGVMIPAFTFHGETRGQIRRQCTHDWKIAPMRRWIQAHRNGAPVEMWLGISLDEVERMKQSDVKYITHHYPLIDLRITRYACTKWLLKIGLEIPARSACVFCPYHDHRTWRELKRIGGDDWIKAIAVDRMVRKARPPYDLFVHPARRPLEEIDLRSEEERGQLSLFQSECEGICFV